MSHKMSGRSRLLIGGAAFLFLAGASPIWMPAAGAAVRTIQQTVVAGPQEIDANGPTDPYALKAVLNAAQNSATAIEGVVPAGTNTNTNAVSGYMAAFSGNAVIGIATPPPGAGPGFGVVGYSSNANGVYGQTNNSAVSALFGKNFAAGGGTGVQGYAAGFGVFGLSTLTNGIVGQTQFAGSAFPGHYGVLGQDTTSTTFNAGTAGSTTNGFGVLGLAQTGNAVVGLVGGTINSGIPGRQFGLTGDDETGTGNHGGVYGYSATSTGVVAQSGSTTAPSLQVYANTGPAIIASNGSGDVMSLDASGNMILKGTLTQSGTPLSTVRSTTGAKFVAYSSQQTLPTIEDVGEAQLNAGTAYISLDPSFASTIDARYPYSVLITPEGDSNGLYVTNKSVRGFAVHESHLGRSSIQFAYRIVAHPYAERDMRLPLADARHTMSITQGRGVRPLSIESNRTRSWSTSVKGPRALELHLPRIRPQSGLLPIRRF